MSMVDLPSREDLKRAIKPWWSGGGTAEILVNLLRREEAELDEARELAKKVADLTDRGYKVSPDMAASIFADQRSATDRRSHQNSNSNNIGTPAWLAEANRKAQESWERFFPGEKAPRANPGEYYSDEADERYRALIRSQREAIRGYVGKKQRKRWET